MMYSSIKSCVIVFFILISSLHFSAQNKIVKINSKKIEYKRIDTVRLNLHVYKPQKFNKNKIYNAIVFFHGGGWNNGNHKMFRRQAMYFASRGLIAICVEYRIKNIHNTTPFDALEDAKSSIRFIRKHAKEMNINPSMIAAAGGSAGGNLAAACGNIIGLDTAKKDVTSSAVPNALVLLNPVVDNGPGGFGYMRFKNRYQEISPIHNITKNAPPTIILIGTKDKFIPIKTVENYKSKMLAVGSACELVLYKDVGHAFFAKKPIKYFIDTTLQSDLFLKSLGYLEGSPTIKEQYKE